MPRQARLHYPGSLHHVMIRGLEGKEVFKDTLDRKEFLKRLENSLHKSKTECHAWALMPNHVHLLIRTKELPLSSLTRGLLSGYAQYFNRRHKRRGYLFQNRYKSVLCQEEEYYLALVRYIHLNPLRAHLVPNYSKLSRYPWCGHGVLLGIRKNEWQIVDEVLCHFGSGRSKALGFYRDFVREGIALGKQEHLTGGGLRRSAGGWSEVIKLKKAKDYWRRDDRILGDGEFVKQVLKDREERLVSSEVLKRKGWDIKKVGCRVCELFEIGEEDLQKKGRNNNISKAKWVLCYWSQKELGRSGREVGEYLGISVPAVCKNAEKGKRLVQEMDLKFIS